MGAGSPRCSPCLLQKDRWARGVGPVFESEPFALATRSPSTGTCRSLTAADPTSGPEPPPSARRTVRFIVSLLLGSPRIRPQCVGRGRMVVHPV